MQITIILNPNVKKSKFKMNKIELLKDSDIPIYFKSFKDSYSEMKSLCPGILCSFIKESINDDFIIKLSKRKKLIGFATIKMLNSKNIFLNLICTEKGLGTQLINIIKEISKKMEIEYIKTDSLDTAVPFYLKNEFQVSQDTCKMTFEI